VLCKYVKPHVTVALSGDGADEIFAGYHKHFAHYNQLQHKGLNSVVAAAYPLLKHLPQSRSNALFNVFRKIVKYAEGASMTTAEAYYKWCSFASENDALALLHDTKVDVTALKSRYFTFGEAVTMNDILLADQKLVLANDMLTKVDRMSMDNSLEVRTPFLDHTFVEFVNSLPSARPCKCLRLMSSHSKLPPNPSRNRRDALRPTSPPSTKASVPRFRAERDNPNPQAKALSPVPPHWARSVQSRSG